MRGGVAHRVVISQIRNFAVCAQGTDGRRPGLGRAFGHEDHGPLSELPGGPGQAPPVIAVRGRDQSDLSQPPPCLGPAKGRAAETVRRQIQTASQNPGHGPGRAQPFECLEAETAGFVLDQDPAQTEPGGQASQTAQGRGAIFREAGVKTTDITCPHRTESGRQNRNGGIRLCGIAGVERQFHATHGL